MADNEIRKSRFSFSELYMIASKMLSFARRDAVEFQKYGIDSAALDSFEAYLDIIKNMAMDEEIKGKQMVATEDKNNAYEELFTALMEVEKRARIVYAGVVGKLALFVNGKIPRMSDSEFLLWCRQVRANAELNLAELAVAGLTADMVTALEEKCDAFELTLQAQQNARAFRKSETQSRVASENELFDKVSMYSKIGKAIWSKTNYALYNDYLLYRGVSAARKRALEKKINASKEEDSIEPRIDEE